MRPEEMRVSERRASSLIFAASRRGSTEAQFLTAMVLTSCFEGKGSALESATLQAVLIDLRSNFPLQFPPQFQSPLDRRQRSAGRITRAHAFTIGFSTRWIHNSVLGLTECHHQQDRVHDSLKKDASNRRPVEARFLANATVISCPHSGGFHHRYCWRDTTGKSAFETHLTPHVVHVTGTPRKQLVSRLESPHALPHVGRAGRPSRVSCNSKPSLTASSRSY
jgi:hypothetical protein